MHRRRTTTLCPPQLLENRCLMAGDVTLSLSGGLLTVQGDSGTNRVTIEGAPLEMMPTLHVVRVSSSDGSTGLVFNGQRTTELTLSGVTRVDVISRGGDDSIVFGSPTRPLLLTRVEVRLGDGADSLDLDHLRVTGALTVTGATGSDTVRLGNVAVLGTTTIDTGLGTDTVRLERETRLTGLLTVLLGDGDDTFTVRGPQAAVQDRFIVTFVTGTSSPGVFEPDRPVAELSLGDVSVKAGAGSDVVEVIGPARIRGDLFVDLGVGAVDRFDVTEGDVEELLFIRFADATLNANVVQQYSPHLFGNVEVTKSGGTANVNVIGAPDVRDDDFVDLGTFAGAEPELFPVFVAGATRIKLSQTDAANVTLRLATFVKDVFVQAGKLGDKVDLDTVGYGGSVAIRTGTGDDDVRARNIRAGGGDAGTFDVRTEAGADTVHLDGIDARRRIGVDTGDGADSVMLNLAHSGGELVVSTGRQDDTVVMLGSSARFRLFADLGAGDDGLEFKNLSFEGVGTLIGGTGTDTLVRRLLSLPFAGTVVDFE